MPKKEKEVKEVKEVEVKEEKKSSKKEVIVSATVLSGTGNFVRTYTEELHSDKGGKDFKEKAEGYAKKIGGTVRFA